MENTTSITNTKRKTYTRNFRVDVNYYSIDYDDKMLETSTAYNDPNEAYNAYEAAKLEKCIDDPEKPARVNLTVYVWETDENGNARGQAQHYLLFCYD